MAGREKIKNNMRKVIVSEFVSLDGVMEEQSGQDILVAGGAELVHTLMQHDLIDEYRIMVHPVVLGSGKRLFRDGTDKKVLRLIDTRTFSSGIVLLCYEPK